VVESVCRRPSGRQAIVDARSRVDTKERMDMPRPNGSRLSCGRLARRRKRSGRTSRARQGTTQRLPLKRERPPASSACQAARPDADVSGEGGGGQGQPRSPPGHRDPPRFHLEGPCLKAAVEDHPEWATQA